LNISFQPNFDFPVGAVAPDAYDISGGKVPHDSFVVSRHRNGSVASVYGDWQWDLSAYHPEVKPSILNFKYWTGEDINSEREMLSHEARYLMFLLIWARNGPSLSIGTLQNYYSVVRAMAKYAEDKSCKIQDLLCTDCRLSAFVADRCSGWMTETLGSLLPLLVKIGEGPLAVPLVGERLLQSIRTRGRIYRTTLKQHAPIPTRIYSKIIGQLNEYLSRWEEIEQDFLSLLSVCAENPLAGRVLVVQYRTRQRLGLSKAWQPNFEQLATKECLDYFFEKQRKFTVKGLSSLIVEVQLVAKLLIQVFTGMRDDEARSLPYHCLEETISNGKKHHVVLGRTTKLNNGRVSRTRWVTNHDGYRAIRAMQRVADSIYGTLGVEAPKVVTKTNDHPLFVSIGYLSLAGERLIPVDGRFRPGQIQLSSMKSLRGMIQPNIEESDILELEHIDPHRAWRSEGKFQLGQPWVFTSHQLRRSLALYAQRSGLVSLPSLRRQLQHITDEMSRYYAKGSAFAKNFIGEDKSHFGLEWQEAQPESAALSYVLNVLLSEEFLFGGHASWVEHRLKGANGSILVDREATLRRFKRGEMAYKETLIGGCTNLEDCDQIALRWLDVDCLSGGCRNMVCNLSKLERVIKAQEKMVDILDRDSLEYRTEKADLDVLVSARDKALEQRNRGFN